MFSSAQAELPDISSKQNCSLSPISARKWCRERKERYDKIQSYHQNNAEGSQALLVGANGGGQVPYIFFRLFAELFPEIWGGDVEPYDRIGLGTNSFSSDPNLPLGIASGPVEENLNAWGDQYRKINKVTFSCVACHSGEVITNSGSRLKIIGAPSTRINNLWFAFARTAQLPAFDASTIRNAILSKPQGWFYQAPGMEKVEERELKLLLMPKVIEELVGKSKKMAVLQLGAFQLFSKFNYSRNQNAQDPKETRRGSLDGLIPSFLAFLRENLLRPDLVAKAFPNEIAEVDSSSLWLQKRKGYKHWDGTQGVDLHRNVGAARANLNDPVNIENVAKITKFINELPSDPYPFDVNMAMAKRGQLHFTNHCVGCHSTQNQIYSLEKTGTDSNRIRHFPEIMANFQGVILKSMCNDPKLCSKPDGTPYKTHELSRLADGYVAGSLEGIWARAPYLHNGSVPTLRALLTKDRPNQFYRGNLNYDQKNVGFSWNYPSPTAIIYDTTRSGNSNSGHDSIEFLGKDWNQNPQDLEDLLEYLKTL